MISHYKLRTSSSSQDASSLHYLNMEQLTKALTSLFSLYEANRSSDSGYENEAEFRSFYVLLHLRSNSQPMVDLYFIAMLSHFIFSWRLVLSSYNMKCSCFWFTGRVIIYLVSSFTIFHYGIQGNALCATNFKVIRMIKFEVFLLLLLLFLQVLNI